MKKRFREINVDGKVYAYVIKNNVDGDGSNRLRVFLNKKMIHETILKVENITPNVIVDIIKRNILTEDFEVNITNLIDKTITRKITI